MNINWVWNRLDFCKLGCFSWNISGLAGEHGHVMQCCKLALAHALLVAGTAVVDRDSYFSLGGKSWYVYVNHFHYCGSMGTLSLPTFYVDDNLWTFNRFPLHFRNPFPLSGYFLPPFSWIFRTQMLPFSSPPEQHSTQDHSTIRSCDGCDKNLGRDNFSFPSISISLVLARVRHQTSEESDQIANSVPPQLIESLWSIAEQPSLDRVSRLNKSELPKYPEIEADSTNMIVVSCSSLVYCSLACLHFANTLMTTTSNFCYSIYGNTVIRLVRLMKISTTFFWLQRSNREERRRGGGGGGGVGGGGGRGGTGGRAERRMPQVSMPPAPGGGRWLGVRGCRGFPAFVLGRSKYWSIKLSISHELNSQNLVRLLWCTNGPRSMI